MHIDSVVEEAQLLRKLGFEMFSLHNAYRNGPVSQLLSPLCNHRTDEYGGNVKGRALALLEIFDALKQTLGRGFPAGMPGQRRGSRGHHHSGYHRAVPVGRGEN